MNEQLILRTIRQVYKVALSPRAYQEFVTQWDAYLNEALNADEDPVVHHIDQALAIVERLEHAGESEISPTAYADAQPGPAALIDRGGDVVAANTAWQHEHPNAASHIWPIATGNSAQHQIRAAIQEVASSAKLPVHLLALDDLDTGGQIHLSFRRLPAAHEGAAELICVRSSRGDWDDGLRSVWEREFGLTAAEIDLLNTMYGGESFAAIAARRGRSPETLKTQSKSIYRKLGVENRETAIMLAIRLHLLADAGRARLTRPINAAKSDFLTLANGTRLAVISDGPDRGRPLIYLHGMTLGHGLRYEMIDALASAGWQLIRIERPGYGRSDPPRDRRRIVEEWTANFPSLLAGLGISRTVLMTHTSGVLYGCAAAARHPELVDGVFAIAGGVPITEERMINSYPAPLLRVARTAKASPLALRFFLRVIANYITRAGGEDKLIRQTYAGRPVDAAALENETIMELTREGMKLVRDGGYHGFIGDAMRIFDDWSEWLDALKCPMVYATGTEDDFCPIDWARAAAQRHANIRVEEIAGAGQLAQHTHYREIVRLLGEFSTRLEQA
ncbi:alpha/beta fold hydrolase [Parasphingopyxis sp.]|uniref:alpha/beta fold hydrolase n=1 Tax=Parasphingopyxis sp. TaxID=1920299 RepID=UPI003FA07CB5